MGNLPFRTKEMTFRGDDRTEPPMVPDGFD
jgi:hypothetical protein